eukprot:UN09745
MSNIASFITLVVGIAEKCLEWFTGNETFSVSSSEDSDKTKVITTVFIIIQNLYIVHNLHHW